MSNRLRMAVLYGVMSILIFGVAIGLTFAGDAGAPAAWLILAFTQLVFAFFAFGYTAGREDQRQGRVK